MGPGLGIVVVILIAYAAIVLGSAALQILSIRLESLLDIRSRNDMEKTMLANLLRKEDKFFLTHSVAEIANRLNVDTRGMIERRTMTIELVTTSMQAIAILCVAKLDICGGRSSVHRRRRADDAHRIRTDGTPEDRAARK